MEEKRVYSIMTKLNLIKRKHINNLYKPVEFGGFCRGNQ